MRRSLVPTLPLATPKPGAPLSLRFSPRNPDHHLWNNNGSYTLHYTIHPTPFTKERIRVSLRTSDVNVARQRRDQFFRECGVALERSRACRAVA